MGKVKDVLKVIISLILLFIPIGAYPLLTNFSDTFSGSQFGEIPEAGPLGTAPPQIPETSVYTLDQTQQRFIEQFQEENSKFIEALIDSDLQLPYDAIFVREDGSIDYQFSLTTATEIGYWLVYLTNIAKGDIRVSNMSPEQALRNLRTALTNIQDLEKWNGLLLKYNFRNGAIGRMADIFDSGNFAASLGVVIGAFIDEPDKREIVSLAQEILDAQKPGWQALYDSSNGLLWENFLKERHFDILGSEGRLGAIMAIVVGDVPESVWRKLSITVKDYTLSNGEKVEIFPPFEGAFQLYFPLMFIPEDEWSDGFDKAHNNYAAVQIDYANQTDLPALRSAASNPYQQNVYSYAPGVGVPGASLVPLKHTNIGATYANSFLKLIDPEKAIRMFEELERSTQGRIWGPYGMLDSVGENGEVSRVYISLDHLAMLISLAGDTNQEYFTRFLNEVGKLEQVKKLYQATEIPITEKVELPEVKQFSVKTPPEEGPPATGEVLLIDFDNPSEYVTAFGRFDGPGEGDYIDERVVFDSDKEENVLEVRYRTIEWNGLWFHLKGLGSLDIYERIVLDLKSSKGMNALKIEIKGNKGGWMHYWLRDIGKEWKTYEIPISLFTVAPHEQEFAKDEILTQFIITIDGHALSDDQIEGKFWVDNIKILSK